jgi:glucosamine kinase
MASQMIDPSPLFVGVEGGGTRATVLITDARGRELARVEGGPGLVEPDQAADAAFRLFLLIQGAVEQIGAQLPAAAVCLGLAGVGREPERKTLQEHLWYAGAADHVRVVTDAEVALYDAFRDGPGLLLIAGTGSVAWGRGADGRTVRVGGWGMLIGDEGGAYAIALDGLRAVAAAHDGRGPATRLRARILQHSRVTAPEGLIAWIAAAPKSAIAALAVPILETAAEGDGPAAGIRDRAAEALAAHVRALHRALAPWNEEPALAMVGGLISPGGPLRDTLAALLARQGPPVRLRPDAVDGARGAAALARRLA